MDIWIYKYTYVYGTNASFSEANLGFDPETPTG